MCPATQFVVVIFPCKNLDQTKVILSLVERTVLCYLYHIFFRHWIFRFCVLLTVMFKCKFSLWALLLQLHQLREIYMKKKQESNILRWEWSDTIEYRKSRKNWWQKKNKIQFRLENSIIVICVCAYASTTFTITRVCEKTE